MRLGDLDDLKKAIEQYQIQWNKNCETDIAKWDSCESILAIIDNAPTVNPCKDCDLYFKAMTKQIYQKVKWEQKGGADK